MAKVQQDIYSLEYLEKYRYKEEGYREINEKEIGIEMIYGVPCHLPKLPIDKTEILNHGVAVEKQKWKRIEIPQHIIDLCDEIQLCRDTLNTSKSKITDVREAIDREIKLSKKLFNDPFIKQENSRIKYGVWIYIKGNPYWLSGHNYRYLQYWNLNVGVAEYRDRDRRWFTFWNMSEKDPNSFGMIYMKHRQEGATYRASCINVSTATGGTNRRGGLVSNGADTAKKTFRIKLVKPYLDLPLYLRPASLEDSTEVTALRWQRKVSHGGLLSSMKAKSLYSDITYKPEQEGAYDGETLAFLHGDEVAKYGISLTKFWLTHQPCLSKGAGSIITGKCLMTSTVGEIDRNNPDNAFKAGLAFKKMWEQSDFWDRNKNGQTASGLYRYFLSAEDGLEGHIDEWGFSIKETAREYILNKTESFHDRSDRIVFKRLHPITEEDALTPDNPVCLFDIDKLKEQFQSLNAQKENKNAVFYKNNYLRGNFKWKDGRMNPEAGAYFEPSEEGVWTIFTHGLDLRNTDPHTSKFNRTKFDYVSDVKDSLTGEEKPVNFYKPIGGEFVIGLDPYKIEQPKGGHRGSSAAASVFMRHNPMDSEKGSRLVAYYLGRGTSTVEGKRNEQKIDDTYDNILAGAFFFSAKVLYEHETEDFMHFCRKCGAYEYLAHEPVSVMTKLPSQTRQQSDKRGIGGRANSKEKGVRLTNDYINENIHKIPFEELITDLIGFSLTNPTRFDFAISFLYTLILAYEPPETQKAPIDMDIFNFW